MVALVLVSSSCEKILNPEPTDLISKEQYYNNEAELQIALTGVYDKLSSLDIYGSNQSFWLTFGTDESTSRLSLTNEPIAEYSYDPANPRLTNFWQALYEGIERANLLLANIKKPAMDDTRRGYIEGEALFLRAYYYFLLVSSFGDVPLKLTPTSSIVNTDIPRTPSKVVYEQIIADMTKAEALVQDVVKYDLAGSADGGLMYAGRVTKSAVQGILARVCLTMAGYPVRDVSKYQLAYEWALKVKSSGRHRLNPDYSDVFIRLASDRYDTQESIWEVEFYGNNTGGYNEGGQALGSLIGILNNVTTNNTIGYSAAYVRVSKNLYDAYAVKNGILIDTRRTWNCPNFTYSDGVKVTQTNVWVFPAGKFRREYEVVFPKDKNFSPINFPVLRYSDVLLMIAEAENEMTNGEFTSVATEAVEEVRRRAYTDPSEATLKPAEVANKEAFAETIRNERFKELCFEGLRKPDLIRWGMFYDTMKEFASYSDRNGGTSIGAIPAKNLAQRHWLLPIPSREMSLNKALVQNVGW